MHRTALARWLIFILLEYESLRDRFIRIAGATDIRAATLALNDAGERLSRYFVSQFGVNLGFGLAIWMSLSVLHFPQALLCGIPAGVMRFVPYVGVGIAALFAAVLALAVDPGWPLAVSTVGVFILLDVAVGQLVEPLGEAVQICVSWQKARSEPRSLPGAVSSSALRRLRTRSLPEEPKS